MSDPADQATVAPPEPAPAEAPVPAEQARSKRSSPARSRQAKVVLRKVGPWSVLKISFLFYLCVMVVILGAMMILYAHPRGDRCARLPHAADPRPVRRPVLPDQRRLAVQPRPVDRARARRAVDAHQRLHRVPVQPALRRRRRHRGHALRTPVTRQRVATHTRRSGARLTPFPSPRTLADGPGEGPCSVPRACSSARLERFPDKDEVDGSSPSRPTRPTKEAEIHV